MTPEDHARAAADLLEAERSGQQIGLLSLRHPEMGMDDAYAIQAAIRAAKLAEGRSVIGWKIGLTSKAMQAALNIDIPDSGILFDDMLFASGGRVPKGRFIQPRVEAEIAFVMKAPLAGADVTREDVLAATDYVTPRLKFWIPASPVRMRRRAGRGMSSIRSAIMPRMPVLCSAPNAMRLMRLIFAGSAQSPREMTRWRKPGSGPVF